MTAQQHEDTLEVALLPLADGRCIVVPLAAIAEVKQLTTETGSGSELGDLDWRELVLPIASLDAVCGLDKPQQEQLQSVAVFKASADSEQPFRALAFTGTAAHRRVSASVMEEAEIPASGDFSGATKIGDQVFLIPNLQGLLFAA
jgi:chemotaxis protein histidine kinase CheA